MGTILNNFQVMELPIKNNVQIQTSSLWEELGWQPSREQIEQLITLQETLIKLNRNINLTRLLQGNDFWIGQVFDSLWPLKNELKSPAKCRSCIDIGTGCGFPGLAIAIALPGSSIILVDAIKRKTNALKEIASEIGLSKRVCVQTERAEVVGNDVSFRGKFDIAVARAVAEAPVVAEYLVPLLNKEGEALIYRGKWNDSDQQKLKKAIKPLKAKIQTISSKQLPKDRGIRHVIRVATTAPCPKDYPRAVGLPKKKPLGC